MQDSKDDEMNKITEDMINIRYGNSKRVARGLFSCVSTCRFSILVLLMTVLGVGEMSGADYKYIFINNKGNEAFNYIISTGTTYTSIDKTKFCVHLKAKSVLATNFRFYTTKAAAPIIPILILYFFSLAFIFP